MIVTDGQQPDQIKYVYVEMVFNDKEKYSIVPGLFIGVKEHKDKTYILLYNKIEDTVAVLNRDYYNIMLIEYVDDNYKNMIVFTKEDKDQKEADAMLKRLHDLLTKNFGDILDPEIIDVSKYSDVPESYKSSLPINGQNGDVTTTHNTNVTNYNNNYGNNYNNKVTTHNSYIKKEPEPYSFNRKEGKPLKEEREILLEKVRLIMSGNYDTELPEIEFDKLNTVIEEDNNTKGFRQYGNYYC